MPADIPSFPERGDVYLVNFDPTIGREIKKTRPALILQNNIGNEFSSTTIVAAITGNGKKATIPVSVLIQPPEGGLTKDSYILLNQIRTIDKQRLGKWLGHVSNRTMRLVNQELRISLGVVRD